MSDLVVNDPTSNNEHLTAASRDGLNKGRLKRRTHFWLWWLHVYTSLASLLIMIFFGVTGITLNHPNWTFGDEPVRSTFDGRLPEEAVVDGDVEFLVVSEYLRSTHAVKGEVANFGDDGVEGTISFKAPGYGAEVFFDLATRDYALAIDQQGFVAVMNDLHKGRDSATTWRWVIDISGVLGRDGHIDGGS